MRRKRIINAGDRFGRLVVVNGTNCSTTKHPKYLCLCDCGATKEIRKGGLFRGDTSSCGCFRIESATRNSTKHGKHGLPEYKVWKSMNDRIANPNNKHWNRYGGRGISICDRWRDFDNFITDMGQRPTPKHQIDRINNDGNYEPSNCRWVTKTENMRNTSLCVEFKYKGQSKTLGEWSEIYGLNRMTLYNRVNRLGWDIEKALTKKTRFKDMNYLDK